jgi:hypothetical protein
LLLLGLVMRASGVKSGLRGVRRWLVATSQRAVRKLSGTAAAAVSNFVPQWSSLVAPLMEARAARVLHLAAALFALGAVAGLYVRGLVFEYRVGWESTFLDPPAVHAILSFFLSPAAQLLGIPFPSVDQIAALRFSNGAPGSASAAVWIHLYAVTVGAIVILPRLLLTLIAGWQVARRSQRFAFDISEPYFRRLAGSFTEGGARLCVVPYSYTVEEASLNGLRALAVALLGDDAEVVLRATVTFGAEDSVGQMLATNTPATLVLALFSLAATPENENHGAFLRALRTVSPASRLAVLLDESGYRRRLGTQAGAEARLEERRSAWRYFFRSLALDAVFADLSAPDLPALERGFERVLSLPASP